jgi:hypothetical protein
VVVCFVAGCFGFVVLFGHHHKFCTLGIGVTCLTLVLAVPTPQATSLLLSCGGSHGL